MGGYGQALATKQSYDMLQRQFLASQYDNLINQPLPDQKTDPEAYQKALDAKAKALEQRQKVYSPEHHANLIDSIHGLITGKQEGAQPQTPPQPAGAPGAPPGAMATPPSGHPFEHNPILAKGDEFLHALGQHLKAAAHPIAPQPGPDWKQLAAAPSPEEIKERQEAEKLALAHRYKMEEIGAKPKPRDTVQKTEWDAEARKLGYTGYDDPKLTAEDVEEISHSVKEANTLPTWKSMVDGDTIYAVDAHDPSKKTAIGKKSEVTTTYYDTIQEQANGDLVRVPMVRYTKKGSGEKIAELPAADAPPTPVSSQAPQPPAASAKNPGARPPGTKPSGGAVRTPRISAKSPQLPQSGQVVGHRPNLLEKSDATTYTKANEDAVTKKEAYTSAQKALMQPGGPTPSSDQELIYSWVRSNVQGAGRMTQAEFKQAASIGSLPERAQNWWNLTLKGRLAPSIEQMMFADIKRAYETAQAEADDLRKRLGPQSSQSPQVPTSGFDPNAFPKAAN